MANLNKNQRWANRIFWLILAFFLISNCVVAGLCIIDKEPGTFEWLAKPFLAGMIIGGLFVLIALYYFYEFFLSPYLEETIKPDEEHKEPRIYVLMARWIIPPLVLQLFVIMGFLITTHKSPLIESIFVQPYKYGQIYKMVEEYNSVMIGLGTFTDGDSTRPSKTKTQILESVSPYFKNGNQKLQDDLKIYKIPYLIAIAFSFVGVLIYALKDTTYRLHTSDLYPKTFISYLIRFIFALALSIAIASYMMNNWWVNASPLIFLFIGFFPQRALQFLEEKAMSLLKLRKEPKQEIPLNLIQGMTDYKIYRFREIGVGDAQNLASVDLTYLYDHLAYNYRLLCDFVSQAILVIHLKDHLESLRGFGIRDVFSYKSVITQENYEEIAQLLNIPSRKLGGFLDLMENEPLKLRLDNILTLLDKSTEYEMKELNRGGRITLQSFE